MAKPHGPHRVAANGQVVIPRELMREMKWAPRQEVYLLSDAGGVLIVPATAVEQWLDDGRPRRARSGGKVAS